MSTRGIKYESILKKRELGKTNMDKISQIKKEIFMSMKMMDTKRY